MSLGGDDPRRQRLAGGLFLGALSAAIAGVLLLSGRGIEGGLGFGVELASTGPLRAGARILLAGREVGEVKGLRRMDTGKPGEHHVVAECFVRRADARHLHRNSDVFISSPSILGESFVEIGPPRGGEPGPLVVEGELLRGSDPPDIDRLLTRLYSSSTEALLLLREQRPAFDELSAGIESLVATVAGIPVDKGQLGRIRDGLAEALDETARLAAVVREAGVVPRSRALARELSQTVERVRPDVAEIGRLAALASERVAALESFVGPRQKVEVAQALASVAEAARAIDRMAGDVKRISDAIDRGDGAIGGLLGDHELFDDLHETHRLLKWKAWRLFLKPGKGSATAPE